MSKKAAIYVVDDDRSVRGGLTTLFEAAGFAVRSYERAESFLEDVRALPPSCVVIDVRLPGMSGLELQRTIARMRLPFPTVMMSGHGDIPMAVAAVKEGALDFIEKPFDPQSLLAVVQAAVAQTDALRRTHIRRLEVEARYATLSPREQDVMRLLIEGHPTKIVAYKLGISTRTAEAHRARVFEKMGTRSLSDLVRFGLLLENTGNPIHGAPASAETS